MATACLAKIAVIPEMNVVMQQKRDFSLLLCYTLARKYVDIDKPTLSLLLYHGRIAHRIHSDHQAEDHHKRAIRLFASVFNFANIRHPHILEELESAQANKLFTNLIRTDGHAVAFIFARRQHNGDGLPDLDADDFHSWELELVFQLWGLDPGITHTYVASNEHGVSDHLSSQAFFGGISHHGWLKEETSI